MEHTGQVTEPTGGSDVDKAPFWLSPTGASCVTVLFLPFLERAMMNLHHFLCDPFPIMPLCSPNLLPFPDLMSPGREGAAAS